jgi:putative tryptophan/tyrosine transport system substrate-binding protein
MMRRFVCYSVCALLLALYASAQAQQPQTFARIGYVFATSSSVAAPRAEAFRQGLRDLGYVEGKNIVIEWRYAENERRLASLTAELLQLKVNVIVTGGGVATRSAKEATSTVPIVMTQDTDPVANGFVVSLAGPGGNITGLSTLAPELSGKRLELLKEIVPSLSRVAGIREFTEPWESTVAKRNRTRR